MNKRLLSIDTLKNRLHVGKSTIYAWVKARTFPAPLKLNGCSRWEEEAVDAWLASKRQD